MTAIKTHLAELEALSSKTAATERAILNAATERLADVQAEIDKLQPGIDSAGADDQQRYLDLHTERGQLQIVTAKAQEALK